MSNRPTFYIMMGTEIETDGYNITDTRWNHKIETWFDFVIPRPLVTPDMDYKTQLRYELFQHWYDGFYVKKTCDYVEKDGHQLECGDVLHMCYRGNKAFFGVSYEMEYGTLLNYALASLHKKYQSGGVHIFRPIKYENIGKNADIHMKIQKQYYEKYLAGETLALNESIQAHDFKELLETNMLHLQYGAGKTYSPRFALYVLRDVLGINIEQKDIYYALAWDWS